MTLTLASAAASQDSPTRVEKSRRGTPRPPFFRTDDTLEHRESTPEEAKLVARLARGESAAFEELVRDYGPRMLALARSYVPTEHDAEDVLQSTFVLVFRFIHRFEGGSQLSTWLHRITVNSALMWLRTRRRHPETQMPMVGAIDELTEPAGNPQESVLNELSARETRDRLDRAVGLLPNTARAAIRIRDVNRRTFAETALLLDRSLSTVKASVHRGRLALRATLSAADVIDDTPRSILRA